MRVAVNAVKWVGIGIVVWVAVAVLLTVGWSAVIRDINRTPRPVEESDDTRALRVVR
jgi:hypothetical protein